MTISVEQLQQRLLPRFPDLEQVEDSVVRFVRRADSRAFAVYYVDVSAQLPGTVEALDEYQDRVIARYFFEGRKSLQWSTYLYFVVDADIPARSKDVIESDRRYARKFIVTETELDSVLSPPSFQVAEGIIDSSVLTTWTNLLAEAKLDRAILNDESLPRRLELIEAGFGQAATPLPSASSIRHPATPPFITRLELLRYRPFPSQKSFVFGTVTLICGANGTGKTSLLEALELLYCGRNLRNPTANEAYKLNATFANAKTESVDHNRPQATFRDRNLAWYGQSEVRTNQLYLSFSRFNFLNTDAAVGLAEAKRDLDDDLSKLLVGPETSKTWREIERTKDKLADKIRELESIRNQVDLEMASVDRQLSVAGDVSQESDSVFEKLREVVLRAHWQLPEQDPEGSAKALVNSLSEYEVLVGEAISFDWVESPVTVETLRQSLQDARDRCSAAEEHVLALSKGLAEERVAAQSLAESEGRLAEADELLRCYNEGLSERLEEVKQIENALGENRLMLAGYDEARTFGLWRQWLARPIGELVEHATRSRERAESAYSQSKSTYSRFAAQRDESISLAQRLRDLAAQMLLSAPDQDVCPLCHTQFPPGELAHHMQAGLDQAVETQAEQLLTHLRESEVEVAAAQEAADGAGWIKSACERLSFSLSVSLGELFNRIGEIQSENARIDEALSRLRGELAALEGNGMTARRYRQLSGRFFTSQSTPASEAKDALIALCTRWTSETNTANAQLLSLRESNRATQRAAEKILRLAPSGPEFVQAALSQLKEQIAAGTAVEARLEPHLSRYPWPEDRPFGDLLIETRSIRKLAGDFQATLANERKSVTVLAEATKRKEMLQKQLAGLVPRIERLSEAHGVLARIRTEYSLEAAMEEALKQNRVAIEAIFARIHAPAEFAGLGSKMTTLVRKDGGSESNLHQVSTGQRAAFALSLFLAQNAQLRSAPPLILIDDPVAHVDDLNCLSFLDYLREVVIAGDRQVVFATANEKLAALFERKFDFLGEQAFRRYDLKR